MSERIVAGPCAFALDSLTQSQRDFIQALPKAELHAHLNGCIPLSCLQSLAHEYAARPNVTFPSEQIQAGIDKLQSGVEFNSVHDFFGLFPSIYALTSTPEALKRATRAVLQDFLAPPLPQCTYLELRSTPRRTDHMTRLQYIEAVLDEVEQYPENQAALIVSLDRRMAFEDAKECMDAAVTLKGQDRRVVGVDICGDVLAGNIGNFRAHIERAKSNGLAVTLHIAEVQSQTREETMQLLAFQPDRLGHATFLDDEAKKIVFDSKMCIEICLTSNILTKTVESLDVHHIRYHLKENHPVAICTDDTLPFRNSLQGEYALLMAAPPLGLGLKNDEVAKIAEMSLKYRFAVQ